MAFTVENPGLGRAAGARRGQTESFHNNQAKRLKYAPTPRLRRPEGIPSSMEVKA